MAREWGAALALAFVSGCARRRLPGRDLDEVRALRIFSPAGPAHRRHAVDHDVGAGTAGALTYILPGATHVGMAAVVQAPRPIAIRHSGGTMTRHPSTISSWQGEGDEQRDASENCG